MKIETLHVFPSYPNANLVAYLHTEPSHFPSTPRRTVIICPGGGYHALSWREDEAVALAWLNAGFQAFVLHYGICEHARNYEPLIEACLAIRYLREHAAEYNVDPEHILITGFSAGGHLAASAGVLWDHAAVRAAFGDVPTRLGRPDGMVLCYPVITAGKHAHRGSFLNLAGKESSYDEQKEYSLELSVSETTPPAFLWHTADDNCVPVENSLLFASALSEYNVPFELHIYPHGVHGLSLCDERTWENNPALLSPVASGWFELAVRWAKGLN
jgi:acetyl esterase/lipase